MKFIKYLSIVISFISFISCSTTKKTVSGNAKPKEVRARRIIKKHVSTFFNEKTLDSRLKVNFKNETEDVSFSVRLKIKKDEVIYLQGSKFIPIFRAKITPEKVQFYSSFKRVSYEGSFDALAEILGVRISFQQLQNLIFGQMMFDSNKAHVLKITKTNYHLVPKVLQNPISVSYRINPKHYRLDKQRITHKNGTLDITYKNYDKVSQGLYPKETEIIVKDKDNYSKIKINFKSVRFNKPLKIRFKMPIGYKKIDL